VAAASPHRGQEQITVIGGSAIRRGTISHYNSEGAGFTLGAGYPSPLRFGLIFPTDHPIKFWLFWLQGASADRQNGRYQFVAEKKSKSGCGAPINGQIGEFDIEMSG
jgi:hypothetical protein